jgi:hypothetical protein
VDECKPLEGGLPNPTRQPYFPQDAAKKYATFDVVVTADARRPIAMFGEALRLLLLLIRRILLLMKSVTF